jgi:hypothetical protein
VVGSSAASAGSSASPSGRWDDSGWRSASLGAVQGQSFVQGPAAGRGAVSVPGRVVGQSAKTKTLAASTRQ